MNAMIFIVFLGLMFIGIPVSAAIGMALFGHSLVWDTVSLVYIGRSMVGCLDSYPILAVPMFILAGEIMGQGGISRRLFNVANAIMGRFTGGVPMATVMTCMLFGAVSGSGAATFSAVGMIMIPLMEKQGYNKKFVTGLTASSGGLGVLIPPSLPIVMYGISVNESIGELFLAGVFPGLISGIALMIYTWFYCKRNPVVVVASSERTMGIRESLKDGFWALLAPIIILGGIYLGAFTATEAAAVAVLYGILVSRLVFKTVKWREVPSFLLNAAALNAPILLIVAMATVLGRVLSVEGVPGQLAEAVLGFSTNPVVILLCINLMLLVVGMFMDTLPAIIILAPILLPIAEAIGLSTIHFGMIMVANLAIGFVTPPIGACLFLASAITKLSIAEISKNVIGPIIALLVALLFIIIFPQLSEFLPGLLRN